MLIRSQHLIRHLLLLVAMLIAAVLTGCADPAPGEGMENPMMQKPLPELASAQDAVSSPDIPTIDPQTLQTAEIVKVLGNVPQCAFRYTAESPPILAIGDSDQGVGSQAVTKIHGRLVQLSSDRKPSYESLQEGLSFTADGMTMRMVSDEPEKVKSGKQVTAELHFSLQQGLNVGYLGWYECDAP